MQDLLNKLKNLGLQFEKASDIAKRKKDAIHLDDVFEGRWVYANNRKIFLIEKVITYGKIIGSKSLKEPKLSPNLFQLFRFNTNPWKTYEEFVFLDTETSSLSIGAGSFIFMAGLCYFTRTGLKILQLILPDIMHEILLLNYLDSFLARFSTIVTYNGKSFDVPIIKSRSLISGASCSIDQLIHLDLLHIARNIWKLRLESRKLSDIEKNILGIVRTDEEIPGWLVPQMYFDYLESGDAKLLKGVAYHNEMDIISVAKLFCLLNTYASEDFKQLKKENMLDTLAIGEILRKGQNYQLAEKVFEIGNFRWDNESIPREYIRKYANVLKRNGNLEKALHFWKIAANAGDVSSCIEISKYYEHKKKDFRESYIFGEKALFLAKKEEQSEKKLAAVKHRLCRIKTKLEKLNE